LNNRHESAESRASNTGPERGFALVSEVSLPDYDDTNKEMFISDHVEVITAPYGLEIRASQTTCSAADLETNGKNWRPHWDDGETMKCTIFLSN
jgi:hypothetical protein